MMAHWELPLWLESDSQNWISWSGPEVSIWEAEVDPFFRQIPVGDGRGLTWILSAMAW